ncbi:MAG: hypothetical protein PHX43_01770 [Alphaproteobacteria bacterium]|nr:hypothetical protein [Alphaproteobacteria bacterium]
MNSLKREREKDSAETQILWLGDAWNKQAQKIERWKNRLSEMNQHENVTPSFRHKIMSMLNQISLFREKETRILDEIDEIEKKHRFMRENNLLKQAPLNPPNKFKSSLDDEDDEYEDTPKRSAWATLFWVWFFAKLLKNDQKPSPSAD